MRSADRWRIAGRVEAEDEERDWLHVQLLAAAPEGLIDDDAEYGRRFEFTDGELDDDEEADAAARFATAWFDGVDDDASGGRCYRSTRRPHP